MTAVAAPPVVTEVELVGVAAERPRRPRVPERRSLAARLSWWRRLCAGSPTASLGSW